MGQTGAMRTLDDERVGHRRRIIGLAGCPGSGKSTLAAGLAAAAPDTSIVVPMDGFHLAQRDLDRLGRANRKGAPDTFDVDGYVALLELLRATPDRVVDAPAFDRHLEEPVPAAIAIEPRHTTIITEGNYLLHDADGWERVHPLLDECWFVDCEATTRTARLVTRHVEHGRTDDEARDWVREVDEPNARLIGAGIARADRIVRTDR